MLSPNLEGAELSEKIGRASLLRIYEFSCTEPTDINEHVPKLRALAKQCSSAAELGVSGFASTWGILQGLAESPLENKSYLGVDLNRPRQNWVELAECISQSIGVQYNFLEKNELELEIDPVDLLFIDSIHTYAHLTYELETFSPKVRKYIAMHDTSEPFTFSDCSSYRGDRSEYPLFINREKRGTWVAVWDFLSKHPEWRLIERHFNSHGFSILKRVDENKY
jgi:hypothetical protein